MDVLGKNLRARAASLGLTLAEAARRSGVSERRFGNYATGLRNPDLQTLIRIAKALQTTPNELLGVNVEPQSEADRLRAEIGAAVAVLGKAHLRTVLLQVRALASSD